MSKLLLASFLALLACDAAVALDSGRKIALEDLGAQVSLSDVAISPDGSRIALIASRADFIDNRFIDSLWLVDVKSGAQRELAPGRIGISSPQWSPDGQQLAWLDAPADGESQVYCLAMADEFARARAVTSAGTGVNAFRWSADGRTLALLSDDPTPSREGEERHNRSFEVGDNDYRLTEAPSPSHLWVAPAAGGEARRITSGGDSIKRIEWMRDGRAIAYVSWPRPHDGEHINASLGVVDVTSGARTVLLQNAEDGKTVVGPLFPPSPDGKSFAFGRPRGDKLRFWPSGVFLLPVMGGASRDVTAGLDRNFRGMAWLPDGSGMLVTAADHTRDGLWLQPLQGEARRLDVGAVSSIDSLSMSQSDAFAFVGSEAQRAAELYVMKATGRPKRLTRFNDRLAALKLGRVTTVSWTLEGFVEDGVLIYPPDFQPGRRYPLVLNIHGGPTMSSATSFEGFDQWLAAQGWLVFSPNYRGSDSQGAKFQTAVINDAGDGPGRDVMAGIAAVKSLGIVDEERVAVSGWSYGGYMTTWLASHYPGWRAAVAGAAVTDWFDWYNLADWNRWAGYGLGGSPWLDGNAANYWRQSPMAYAHQIRTPTLILSNTADQRVTVTQSYKLYHALKDNGVPVQFIAYPIGGHWPQDPVHERDVHRRWMEWIAERFRS